MFGLDPEPCDKRTVLTQEEAQEIKVDGKRHRLMKNWAGQPMLVESFSGEWCPICGMPLPVPRKGLQRLLYGETGHYCRWWTNP